jgi:creatine kinase
MYAIKRSKGCLKFLSLVFLLCFCSNFGFAEESSVTCKKSKYGGEILGDSKDTQEFCYFTYKEYPSLKDNNTYMAQALSPEIFKKLKDKKTAYNYTLSNAIQAGVESSYLVTGIAAGDEFSYEVFRDLMYPVIKNWHGFDPEKEFNKTNLDPSQIKISKDQQEKLSKYVSSTRVRAARSVSGLPLPAGMLEGDRAILETLLKKIISNFKGGLRGTYFPIKDMPEKQAKKLISRGMLFKEPHVGLQVDSGIKNYWPNYRGIFINKSEDRLMWVGEEDHIRIIAMEEGADIKSVFEKYISLHNALKVSFQNEGRRFMYNNRLGFLASCPSNIGTSMRASLMIKLPNLTKNQDRLKELVKEHGLDLRGGRGTGESIKYIKNHSDSWDISNKKRIGASEVELIQNMIEGALKIIEEEEKLNK